MTPAAPTTAPMPPSTAQAPGGYQSFSYEPGAPVANPGLVPVQTRSATLYNQFRGDRKALGAY
ncbi:MAG: hypothetical protein JSS49_15475 [Planctomycetes bacterium]|nr:hypothetical protein [Planctomycetota bacterium]